MAEYPWLALGLITFCVLLDALLQTKVLLSRGFWFTLTAATILTLISTQFLDGLPIVEYNHENTLGFTIGYMPLEDLSYTVAACILVPAVWKKIHDKK